MTAAQFRKTVSGVGGYSSSAMTSKCTTHGCPGDIHKLLCGNVCVVPAQDVSTNVVSTCTIFYIKGRLMQKSS